MGSFSAPVYRTPLPSLDHNRFILCFALKKASVFQIFY